MLKRIKKLEQELQTCMEERDYDAAANIKIRILSILEESIIKDTVIQGDKFMHEGKIKE